MAILRDVLIPALLWIHVFNYIRLTYFSICLDVLELMPALCPVGDVNC